MRPAQLAALSASLTHSTQALSMSQKTPEPPHELAPSNQTVKSPDLLSTDEFEVTIAADEDGDPDRFHITSISPRPRR